MLFLFAIYFSKCNGIELVAIDEVFNQSCCSSKSSHVISFMDETTRKNRSIFSSIFQVFAIFPLRSRTFFLSRSVFVSSSVCGVKGFCTEHG